jgi:hypothetical protein
MPETLATYMCRLPENPGSLNFLELLEPFQACSGTALTFVKKAGTKLKTGKS